MKITIETLTDNQKEILKNGAMPNRLEGAHANLDLQEKIGFEAFKTAQLGLKVSGLILANYSLTVKGQELFKELMSTSIKPIKEDPAMPSTVVNHPHQAKEVIRANLTKCGHADMFDESPEPWQCHDKGCLCHDEHKPTAKQVHAISSGCNCGSSSSVALDVNPACPIHGWEAKTTT